jgi:hypothetical protein
MLPLSRLARVEQSKMKKVALIMLIIAVVVFGIGYLLRSCESARAAPSISEAKWVLKAGASFYYTKNYTQGKDNFGSYVILKTYWDSADGGKTWSYHNGDIKFSERGFGPLIPVLRPTS